MDQPHAAEPENDLPATPHDVSLPEDEFEGDLSYKAPPNLVYDEAQIDQLAGLDVIRQRPALFIGSTDEHGLHQLVAELLDNAVDEHLANFGNFITITVHRDASVSVEDEGRGIPVGEHPKHHISTVELVFTKLHAGGKFDQSAYGYAGGLHGVGAKCVNAFSKWCEVESRRNGKTYRMRYENGVTTEPLHEIGAAEKTGVSVRFMPDAAFFETGVTIEPARIEQRLQALAYLNPKLTLRLVVEGADPEEQLFHYDDGVLGFIAQSTEDLDLLHEEPIVLRVRRDTMFMECFLQYHSEFGSNVISFVNNVPTPDGGIHVSAFRNGIAKAINRYGSGKGLIKDKGPRVAAEDAVEGLIAVINLRVPAPQYASQTKSKLVGPAIDGEITTSVSTKIEAYLEAHPKEARAIIEKLLAAARAREKARNRRGMMKRAAALAGGGVPPELSNLQSRTFEGSELYLVARLPCDAKLLSCRAPEFQAVLPLDGKLPDPQKAPMDKVLENEAYSAIVAAIGAGVDGDEESEDKFEFEKRRFDRVIVLSDITLAGRAARAHILTFLAKYMGDLIAKQKLLVTEAPVAFEEKPGEKSVPLFALPEDDPGGIQPLVTLATLSRDELRGFLFEPVTRNLLLAEDDMLMGLNPEAVSGAKETAAAA